MEKPLLDNGAVAEHIKNYEKESISPQTASLLRQVVIEHSRNMATEFSRSTQLPKIKILTTRLRYLILAYTDLKLIECFLKRSCILFFLSISVFFFSCFEKKSDTQVNLKANLNTIPTQEMFNSQIIRTDSGRAVMQIKAPVIQFFDFDKKKSYTLLPKGGEVKKYNIKSGRSVYIRSDWAKIDNKKVLYEGKGNVVIISENGDTIKTNHIFWNRRQNKVYNHVKTYIIRPNRDSLIAKKGLEADDQFKNVNLRNTETITKNAQLK